MPRTAGAMISVGQKAQEFLGSLGGPGKACAITRGLQRSRDLRPPK